MDVEHAVIVGQGNVALDVARILLTPVDELRVGTVNFFYQSLRWSKFIIVFFSENRHHRL